MNKSTQQPSEALAIPFLDLGAAYRELKPELDEAVRRVLASGWYLLSGELAAFEAEFADFVGAKFCVGVANGLDALKLSLLALGVQRGDEVIVPSNTYIATWLACSEIGATIIPVEPDPVTYNLDPAIIEKQISARTRVILPVHLYGFPAAMEEIRQIAKRHHVAVLEDAAQAHGTALGGIRAGSLGDIAAWSFYPGKNLGAFGDGGAVTTNDAVLADAVRVLRNYGSRVKYVNEVRGFNSRLDEVQAAVLRVKLRTLTEWNQRRSTIAAKYRCALGASGLGLPPTSPSAVSCWHLFVVRHPRRDDIKRLLDAARVGTLIHYPIPPHRQTAYADLLIDQERFPIANQLADQLLSLPIGPHLTEAQTERVIDSVLGALATL